jgi:phage terminase large subunit
MPKPKTTANNPFKDFLDRYENNPVLFVEEVIGADTQPWQAEMLALLPDPNQRRIAVRSGHGVGKSTGASWAMLWHLLCRYPQKCVVTSPTSAQLFDALFAELKATIKKLPPMLQTLIEVGADKIWLKGSPDDSFISARTSRAETPEALAGVHSEHVLLIVDEASGVPEQVFEAAVGSMSGHSATTILLGNPTRSSGYFYRAFHQARDQFYRIHVNAEKSDLVSKEFCQQVARTYGETSNAYRVRVLGEWPLSDDDTVIPVSLLDAAMQREITVPHRTPTVWGLDVARFGQDSSALCKRKGRSVIEPIKRWRNMDLMQLCGAVVNEYNTLPEKDRPVEILVDVIGLGSGVVDRLTELNLPVRGINVSESSSMSEQYRNLRAELWYKARDWLAKLDCSLPKDEQLCAELATVKYAFTSNGKIQIESKDDIRKRGLPSPDLADAFCLTFASDAATVMNGGADGIFGKERDWSKPIDRVIPMLT